MIPDWQTNRVHFSDLLPRPNRHSILCGELASVLHQAGVEPDLLAGTRDIWVRDFMPLQVAANDFVLFRYRPRYLRRYPRLVTPDEARAWVPPGGRLWRSEINLDGGNVVASSNRVVLTDRIYEENPGRDRGGLQAALAELLRAEVCIIPAEPGDLFGHADGIVRFINDSLVVVNDYREVDPCYGEELEATLCQHGLTIERLPHFRVDEEQDGIPSAVGNFVNFLRVGQLVVVPAYGAPQDEAALQILEGLLPPGAEVIPLPCEELARPPEGGVLNCVSWTTAAVGR